MDYAKLEWRDGQPYSTQYDDIYYSRADGREESEYVFLKHNGLPERWRGVERFIIAETGFGTGLNFVLTVKQWLNHAPDSACLHYIGIEKHPVSPDDIRRMRQQWPDLEVYFDALLADYPLPVAGQHIRRLFGGRVELQLVFMDVLDALADRNLAVDAWYLDGFGPAKNPDLWSEAVCSLLAQNSKASTTLATYTCAGKVRRGLQSVGFDVERVKGHGAKREMIQAVMNRPVEPRSSTPWYQYPSASTAQRKAVVLGAGLAGLSTAWALTERGWQVTIIDRHADVAAEASGNLAGLVMPRLSVDNTLDEQFYASAFLHSRHRLHLLNAMGDEPVWFESGVYLGLDAAKANKLLQRHDYFPAYLRRAEPTDDAVLSPVLANEAFDVVELAAAGWALTTKVCERMLQACDRVNRHAVNMLQAEVSALHYTPDGWELRDGPGRSVHTAEVVVLANGTGINQLAETANLPVHSIRGQVTVLPVNGKSQQLKQAVSFDSYVTPAFDGQHITGASYSLTETSRDLLESDQLENLRRLQGFMPDVFSLPEALNGRAGFRAVSADRVPLVGAVPDYEVFQRLYKDLHLGRRPSSYVEAECLPGLYITAGHGSRGLSSCLFSADILACMIDGSPLPVGKRVLDYLNPARFIVRQLRRNRSTDQ